MRSEKNILFFLLPALLLSPLMAKADGLAAAGARIIAATVIAFMIPFNLVCFVVTHLRKNHKNIILRSIRLLLNLAIVAMPTDFFTDWSMLGNVLPQLDFITVAALFFLLFIVMVFTFFPGKSLRESGSSLITF